jgi:hypothetical protein
MCFLNTALSAASIFGARYAGGRSVFGFIAQVLLLAPQLLVTWTTASESHRGGLALSLFRTHQASFNIILPQYTQGKYFMTMRDQDDEHEREELHGRVVSSAARYLQERLRVAEKYRAEDGEAF